PSRWRGGCDDAPGGDTVIQADMLIRNQLGLHARACALFVKAAARFQSEVWVARDDLEVNGKSIMGVMMLAAEEGATIRVRAEADADAELSRFRDAVELSRHELERIRDGIAHELGEDEARIYDAHLMILEDPELWRAVEDGVRRDHRNAAVAYRSRIGQVAAH